MMKVLVQARDLADDYVRFVAQIGADGFDISPGADRLLPGVIECGYADPRGTRELRDKLRRWGLDLYRVAPPTPVQYLLGESGGEREVDDLCRTVEALGKAGISLVSMPIDIIPVPRERGGVAAFRGYAMATHRGGYRMIAFEHAVMEDGLKANPPELVVDVEAYFERCLNLYQRLIPIAEEYQIHLVLHPSDPPLPDTPLSPRRWTQILDLVPSRQVGLLYCVGTRYETGLNVYDDIRTIGSRGKIFHVHFRNVRGTLPSTGGYEEVAIDDGDISMFRVLQMLKSVGYDGGLQVDHLPTYDAENAFQGMATAYAVGYIRALLRTLEGGS